jgi:hypothetical protein
VKRALILLLFLVPRVALLFLRQPFYDELFTQWIAAKSFAGILDALRFDSGPPLYYWVLHLLDMPTLFAARAMSLVFSAVALIAILAAEKLGETRYAAAALIAVFPPAVLSSVDARAYALCAMFVTIGVIALAYEKPYVAAAMFVVAGYSHYYGALFLVLLLPYARAFVASAVLYAPAVWLALHQPRAAIGWMSAWRYPDALFVRPPLVLAIAIAVVMLAVVLNVGRALARPDGLKPVLHWAVPLAFAIIAGVYVPMRFEAIIAAPLALWLAPAKRMILIPLGLALALWTALGILDHARRPPDDYRTAATWLADNVRADQPVVASGYLYLETIAQRPATAFPSEQAQHPGWRAVAQTGSGLPAGPFFWIGERTAPELILIRRARRIDPIYVNSNAMVVKVH